MQKRAAPTWIAPVIVLVAAAGTPSSPGAAPDTASRDDPAAIPPAYFPHDEHAEDFEIDCAECHHETDAAPLTFPHTDYFDDFWIDCRICHHEPGAAAIEAQRCSACHHGPNGDITDETLSAKVVVHQSCWSCHEVGTGAEAAARCADCHRE